MITEVHTTKDASIAGQSQGQSPADQKRASERLSSYHKHCPYGEAYLRKAARSTPPRPEQHQLVMKWPKFDCVDQLEREHWEFGGQVLLPGLLLHGVSGTGKTTSAYVAISETLDCWSSRGTPAPDVLAVGAVEMGRRISELSRSGGDDLEQYLGDLSCAGLLFIDDLDKARFTPRVESELFDILEYREVEELPVIVTTNLKGRQLEKMFSPHIGPAIVNRLRRTCIPIDFDEPEFDAEAALAAVQAKIRADYVPQAEAQRAYHLGEKPQWA